MSLRLIVSETSLPAMNSHLYLLISVLSFIVAMGVATNFMLLVSAFFFMLAYLSWLWLLIKFISNDP